MKIGIDFDGVCTDLARLAAAGLNIPRYLYSPLSVTVAEPREGIRQLLSVLGLFGDLLLVSARPESDRPYIVDWLRFHSLDAALREVVLCGDNPKGTVLGARGISLHVDDSICDMSAAAGIGLIPWRNETWREIVVAACRWLASSGRAVLKARPNSVVTRAMLASDWGASPAFILTCADGTRLKLRAAASVEIRNRIVNLLRCSEAQAYKHVARLITVNDLAVLKTFVVGTAVGEAGAGLRLGYVERTGKALAQLHALPILTSPVEGSLSFNGEPPSLLVCSADNRNTIVTNDGDVAFIDLEACTVGSRWIDVCWAECLLCRSDGEREAFRRAYSEVAANHDIDDCVGSGAAEAYQVWLTKQLLDSYEANRHDVAKSEAIITTLRELWNKSRLPMPDNVHETNRVE